MIAPTAYRARFAGLCFAVLVALAAAPAIAGAVEPLGVDVSRVYYGTRVVSIEVDYPVGCSRIDVSFEGQPLKSVAAPSATETGTVRIRATLPKPDGTVVASAVDAADAQVARGVTEFEGSQYRPVWLKTNLVPERVFGSKMKVGGDSDRRTRELQLWLNGKLVRTIRPRAGWDGRYVFDAVRLRSGANWVLVKQKNAWGTRSISSRRVWNLGSVPSAYSYLLVDKSELRLYHVKRRILVKRYPVAIGMPGTPTPNGDWRLGSRRWLASRYTAWGVLRMPLYRLPGMHFGGYYIHGTNDPESIGTMASHGCIRMYNRDVIALSESVSSGITVRTRP